MKISESKILSSIMCGCYCYLHLYKGCTTFYFETATHGHYFIQLWLRDDPITWDVRVKCEKECCEYIFNPHTSTQVLLVARAMRWSLSIESYFHLSFCLQTSTSVWASEGLQCAEAICQPLLDTQCQTEFNPLFSPLKCWGFLLHSII